MDDAWETTNGLDPTDDSDRNKLTKSGYTCLEVYLNSLVGEHIDLDFTSVSVKDFNRQILYTFLDHSLNTLFIQSNQAIHRATLCDLYGRIMDRFVSQDITGIDIYNLPNGLYILQLETEKGVIVQTKFIK